MVSATVAGAWALAGAGRQQDEGGDEGQDTAFHELHSVGKSRPSLGRGRDGVVTDL
jgi:hypothetical protein